MIKKLLVNNFFYVIIAAILIRLLSIIFVSEVHTDLRNDLDWGIRFWQYGPSFFYKSNVWSFDWPNQPPGTIIVMAFIRKLYETIFNIFWFINIKVPPFPSNFIVYLEKDFYAHLTKILSCAFDFGIVYYIYKYVSKVRNEKIAKIIASVFILNPVIWYNSAVWGQYDSINNFFAVASIYYLLDKKIERSLSLMIISISVKISLIIYLPLFLLIIFIQKYKLIRYLKAVLLGLFVYLVIFIPFSSGNVFYWTYQLYEKRVLTNQLQLITANAFNLWGLIKGIHQLPHNLEFFLFSYKVWGLILFVISYILIILGLFKKKLNKISFFHLFSLIAISSFMLLTNMHERYLYPFFTLYIMIIHKDKISFIYYLIFSFINLINLYNFWWVPKIPFFEEILSYNNRIITRYISLIGFSIYLLIFVKYIRENKLLEGLYDFKKNKKDNFKK